MTLLAHEVRGEGDEVVLLLHGFLGSGQNLSRLARSWAQKNSGLRVVTCDLAGHGSSPPLPAGAGLSEAAAPVLDLVRELSGNRPARLVGHSLGGRVAVQAAADGPDGVEDVTLLDIAPGPIATNDGPAAVVAALLKAPEAAGSRGEMQAHLKDLGIASALLPWLLMNLTPEGERYTWRIDRRALAAFHEKTRTADLWPLVESGSVRIRACIRGGNSAFVSDADLQRLSAAGAMCVTLEAVGHFLHVEDTEGTLKALWAAHG